MQTFRFLILIFLVGIWDKKLVTFHVINLLLQIIMCEENLRKLILILEILASKVFISLLKFLKRVDIDNHVFD